jgi:hypothetical protein
MAYQAVRGMWMPEPPAIFGATPAFTSQTIAATGNKLAFSGRVITPNRGSKNITKVGFLTGTIVSAGTSILTLSLQDVSTTAGSGAPDETQDQTVAVPMTGLSSDTYFHSAALNATRTVADGDLLSVVIEFDGGGRLGADSFTWKGFTTSGVWCDGSFAVQVKTSGTWTAAVNTLPNVVLEFDDGTFGTIEGAIPSSAVTNQGFNSGSSPNEYALKFTVAHASKIDGGWVAVLGAATRDFSVKLYENSTTATATASIDAETVNFAAMRIIRFKLTETTLTPGTVYYLSVAAGTVSNNTVCINNVNAANHFQGMPGGTSWHLATRAGGAWTAVTTQRLMAGLRISALDDAVSAGGTTGRIIGG